MHSYNPKSDKSKRLYSVPLMKIQFHNSLKKEDNLRIILKGEMKKTLDKFSGTVKLTVDMSRDKYFKKIIKIVIS